MKKIILASLIGLVAATAVAEQIPSTFVQLKGLVPAGTSQVFVKWSDGKTSTTLPATMSGRTWSFEAKKGNYMENNIANVYQTIFQKKTVQTQGPKRVINVLADELKIGDTTYFYDISSKDSRGKLLFADNIGGGYFTKSCLNNFSTYWENGNISGKTDNCLLIDSQNNILRLEKTSSIDNNLFAGDFGDETIRCSQFGQILDEKGQKIGTPICLKSSGETTLSYQNGYIISSIKNSNFTYNFIYSKTGNLLAKLKFNKYESTIEANNQLYKVFMFANSGGKTKFLGADDEFKFWNGIYYSPYTFLYEKQDGKWVLKKAGTLGLIDDKLYTSVDSKIGTVRGISTDVNGKTITISNDFFTQNFDIFEGLGDVAFKPETQACGDMKNNIKIFRYNQNDITDVFSQTNNVNDQYIIQGNFGTDGNVIVYGDKSLEGTQPKTQGKGYFRYYISKTIGNLKTGANNFEIVLMSKDGNKKLCKTDISLITK